ncbi:MAG: hypothetical protein Q8L48_03910 [Archangium sp.]|nr:hypothetical protein [Archangium sp.]
MIRTAAVVLVLAACESARPTTPTSPPEPRSSLRVPLPDGWRATTLSAGAGLQVGPQGRVVLQLESTTRPLPTAEAFVAALSAEGVEILEKESVDTFVGVRYSMTVDGAKRDAFLGVRQTGPRTIWCSTTGSAKSEEVEAAMTVCRSLSWEG